MGTLNGLIKAMSDAGHSATNRWDMVCSYSQELVNRYFAEKFSERALLDKISIDYTYTDEEQIIAYSYKGNIVLKDPSIEFLSIGKNQCKLIMPISNGMITKTTSVKGSIIDTHDYPFDPYTVQLICIVPIASIVGNGKISEGDTPISFIDDKMEEEGKFFLHFENSKDTSFKFEAIPGQETLAEKNPFIKETPITSQLWVAIAMYFKQSVSSIDYELASVKSIPDAALSIKPKAFIFSLNQPNENTIPALMIYIQTADSGFEQGDTMTCFQIAGTNMSPLPDGYNASFMIRAEYLDKLLVRAFSQYNAKVKRHNPNALELELSVNKTIQTEKTDHGVPGAGVVDVFDGITINLSHKPFRLLVELKYVNNAWKTVKSLQYQSEEGEGKYRYSSPQTSFSGRLIATIHIESKSFPKEKPIEDVPMEFVSSDFDLSISIKDNPNMDITVNVKNEGKRIAKWLNIEDQRRLIEKQFKSQVSEISLSMKAIDTFIARNLLLPDKFEFKLDQDCYIPKDYIAFGNLNKVSTN